MKSEPRMNEKIKHKYGDHFPEMKWGSMVALSVAFHLGIFLAIIFIPETIPARHIPGVVYEVDLVTLPAPVGSKRPGTSSGKGAELPPPAKRKQATKTRRIPTQKKAEKPLVIAKRTVEAKKITPPQKRLSSTKLIDRAISKIEDRVKKEDAEKHVERAIRELEKKAVAPDQAGSEGGGSGGSEVAGISKTLYQMEVETHIKSNWSYPVALRDSEGLEATVLIKVNETGHIIDFRFKKRSTDNTFNDSVLKAVERSDPLPPFPEVFGEKEDEIEVNFNLKDLER